MNRWIPIGTVKPMQWQSVLITIEYMSDFNGRRRFVTYGYLDGNKWHIQNPIYKKDKTTKVLAWQPLPDAYDN